MTHEEEEVQHDISNLWDQVQKISLSQRETRAELKRDMDGFKNDMEAKIDGIEEKIEGLKEGLTKLLQ